MLGIFGIGFQDLESSTTLRKEGLQRYTVGSLREMAKFWRGKKLMIDLQLGWVKIWVPSIFRQFHMFHPRFIWDTTIQRNCTPISWIVKVLTCLLGYFSGWEVFISHFSSHLPTVPRSKFGGPSMVRETRCWFYRFIVCIVRMVTWYLESILVLLFMKIALVWTSWTSHLNGVWTNFRVGSFKIGVPLRP